MRENFTYVASSPIVRDLEGPDLLKCVCLSAIGIRNVFQDILPRIQPIYFGYTDVRKYEMRYYA